MRTLTDYTVLIGTVVFCECTALVGSVLSRSGFGDWYDALNKPAFMPPGWLFAPVWLILYALMGIAAYLVYASGAPRRTVVCALMLFAVQLGLNLAWTPLFFGMHHMGWALVDCAALWCAIAATMLCFSRASRGATVMMAPYLLWVSFALVLNAAIWHLNR